MQKVHLSRQVVSVCQTQGDLRAQEEGSPGLRWEVGECEQNRSEEEVKAAVPSRLLTTIQDWSSE